MIGARSEKRERSEESTPRPLGITRKNRKPSSHPKTASTVPPRAPSHRACPDSVGVFQFLPFVSKNALICTHVLGFHHHLPCPRSLRSLARLRPCPQTPRPARPLHHGPPLPLRLHHRLPMACRIPRRLAEFRPRTHRLRSRPRFLRLKSTRPAQSLPRGPCHPASHRPPLHHPVPAPPPRPPTAPEPTTLRPANGHENLSPNRRRETRFRRPLRHRRALRGVPLPRFRFRRHPASHAWHVARQRARLVHSVRRRPSVSGTPRPVFDVFDRRPIRVRKSLCAQPGTEHRRALLRGSFGRSARAKVLRGRLSLVAWTGK